MLWRSSLFVSAILFDALREAFLFFGLSVRSIPPMRRRNLMTRLIAVFAVLLAATCAGQAQAAGYWNMPGTHAQRAGHGYGGGYHAPLILGPIQCDGWHLGMPVRLPSAPSPYYGCGSYGDCGQMAEATSSMESVVPTTAPAPAPMPSAAVPTESRTVDPVPPPTSEVVVQTPEPAAEANPDQIVEPARPLFDPPVQK
jgi:hypothetical protein